MIEAVKRVVRRHWPRLRLRTILLLTFVFVAALPGVGALFLRVYENTLVRQTEAELIAQGAALAAAAAADWPGAGILPVPPGIVPEPPTIDLRLTPVLPPRPAPGVPRGPADGGSRAWGRRLAPVLNLTSFTTLATILLIDRQGRVLAGRHYGRSYAALPEVRTALAGSPATTLRRNAAYRPGYPLEGLSRAANLLIHHARPIVADGRVVGVLLLSRAPRSLFVGIDADRGKIAFGVAAIFATLVILSGLLSRGIVRPVEALRRATRAVASGGGTVPLSPTTAAIEIQDLYRDFAVMADAIERRSRYLRDFAHAVSHEFKTPLAGIAGAIELLHDHPDMAPADRERFLSNMGCDAERLTLLVTRLLDLARADMTRAGAGVATDLADVVRRVADAHRGPTFAVTVDLPVPSPRVGVPGGMVEAVLASLFDNSRQAGATTVGVAARPAADHVVLTVQDDGPGIPAGNRDRIFEPFFTTRRTAGGTGLGLSITRSLLHAHGGSITLGEQQGHTRFTIALPTAI
ncbi:HAMP domain-containing sensor histidine kinase [Sphingomonas montana]|uniref:HAMP domain-containing sensor histidine kinase n=1 Tax=Sphingomonas montana TaxID=1843236 RepID=UPI00096C19C0|nr:HAMP domain-containing sensor histidine kinase [Sphingomonas montana]